MERMSSGNYLSAVIVALLVLGCQSSPKSDPSLAAKNLFDETVTNYHLPSAEAKGAGRDRLLARAADGYTRLLRQYASQPFWCAQAMRSLGNVRATQGHLDEAIVLYRRVGEKYRQEDWEVLQAWKSAADLLWDAGHKDNAKEFYRQIITRFDRPDMPPLYRVIVTAARRRLSEQHPSGGE